MALGAFLGVVLGPGATKGNAEATEILRYTVLGEHSTGLPWGPYLMHVCPFCNRRLVFWLASDAFKLCYPRAHNLVFF